MFREKFRQWVEEEGGEACHGYQRHFHGGRHGFWAEPGGFRGRGWGRFGGEFGGRLFDPGELRLVILQMIAEKPSYGYEMIKAIGEKLEGAYSPSAGVVYPTLTLLEEEGFATVTSAEGGKKLYAITDAGREELKASRARVDALFARLNQAGEAFGKGRSPKLMRAMHNMKLALKLRFAQGDLTKEQIAKIAEILDDAARGIESV
ncbi:PadR family transcriptional regulator [Paracidobacterium acidisoli]|uniref:PadR family transcriptional regulator n=1 Tax=Paracidobacterium acidisoli TaxID=2303751 RepID=A0A372IN58_9BACT|nr:PadR family transcriptional regulator [Paracidobacterium acidisoli]MBT9331821.1 PadR family transcriptional regulator [Paracidobacterium acidisoli]